MPTRGTSSPTSGGSTISPAPRNLTMRGWRRRIITATSMLLSMVSATLLMSLLDFVAAGGVTDAVVLVPLLFGIKSFPNFSMSSGNIFLNATGTPRQLPFQTSPKAPLPMTFSKVTSLSSTIQALWSLARSSLVSWRSSWRL